MTPAQLKSAAHNAVADAIRKGVLVRARFCSECGNDHRIEGHHDDYALPLVVRWLCKGCHVRHHLAVRTPSSFDRAAHMRAWWATPRGDHQREMNRRHAAARRAA